MEEAVVQVEDLSKDYILKGETVKALENVSLEIKRREFMAIAGPSGSGKTTLLNIIGALDEPTGGDVVLEGERLGKVNRRRLSVIRGTSWALSSKATT